MTRDQRVVGSDGRPGPLKVRPNVGGMLRGAVIESEHSQSPGQLLDLIRMMVGACGKRRAKQQLGQHHCRNAEVSRAGFETF